MKVCQHSVALSSVQQQFSDDFTAFNFNKIKLACKYLSAIKKKSRIESKQNGFICIETFGKLKLASCLFRSVLKELMET